MGVRPSDSVYNLGLPSFGPAGKFDGFVVAQQGYLTPPTHCRDNQGQLGLSTTKQDIYQAIAPAIAGK